MLLPEKDNTNIQNDIAILANRHPDVFIDRYWRLGRSLQNKTANGVIEGEVDIPYVILGEDRFTDKRESDSLQMTLACDGSNTRITMYREGGRVAFASSKGTDNEYIPIDPATDIDLIPNIHWQALETANQINTLNQSVNTGALSRLALRFSGKNN
jgi:hypothetical protein